MMRIAIPIRDSCVSPAFDFSHRLLLVEFEDGRETRRSEAVLVPESSAQRAGRLRDLLEFYGKFDILLEMKPSGVAGRNIENYMGNTGLSKIVQGPGEQFSLFNYLCGGV